MRYIYVGQFDYCFRLTIQQWRTLCEAAAGGAGYDLLAIGAKELKRFPEGVVKSSRDSAQRSSIYTDLIYYEPLDWEPDEFKVALDALDQTPAPQPG